MVQIQMWATVTSRILHGWWRNSCYRLATGIPLVDLLKEGEPPKCHISLLIICKSLLSLHLMVLKLLVLYSQVLQPVHVNEFVSISAFVGRQIWNTDFNHLCLWVACKNLAHSVSKNRHEIFLCHLLKFRVSYHSCKWILQVLVQGELDLSYRRQREVELWIYRFLLKHLFHYFIDISILLSMANRGLL